MDCEGNLMGPRAILLLRVTTEIGHNGLAPGLTAINVEPIFETTLAQCISFHAKRQARLIKFQVDRD